MNTIKVFIVALMLLGSTFSMAMGDDNPTLTKLMLDQLEVREDDVSVLEGDLWVGKDLNKLWFKTEIESEDSNTEEAELQALYSRAISPYWDLQVGLRHDFKLDFDDSQNWAVIGLQGLAPYFFEIDSALFVGDGGDTALRLTAEYELLLTQRWVLIPELEFNLYGQNTPQRGRGSGVSDAELGLRLAYYPRREIAPYLGYNWSRLFGDSADMAEADGGDTRHQSWVAGIKIWF